MGALAKLRVTTGEGNQIVAVGEVIAPSGGSGRKDKGIQALVSVDVALPHEGGLRDVPAIAASGGIGGAVIFEIAGGEGGGGWLKVDQGSAGGRRGGRRYCICYFIRRRAFVSRLVVGCRNKIVSDPGC